MFPGRRAAVAGLRCCAPGVRSPHWRRDGPAARRTRRSRHRDDRARRRYTRRARRRTRCRTMSRPGARAYASGRRAYSCWKPCRCNLAVGACAACQFARRARSSVIAMVAPPVRIGRQALRERVTTEFLQRAGVYTALEEDDFPHRVPVVDPARAFEFRRLRRIESNVLFAAHQAQQEPALLLSDAKRLRAVADVTIGQTIVHPALGRAEHRDVLASEADLLGQFTKERIDELLVLADAALGKLPATPARPAAQEQLIAVVHQHDADVRTVTVVVDEIVHDQASLALFHNRLTGTTEKRSLDDGPEWAADFRRNLSSADPASPPVSHVDSDARSGGARVFAVIRQCCDPSGRAVARRARRPRSARAPAPVRPAIASRAECICRGGP